MVDDLMQITVNDVKLYGRHFNNILFLPCENYFFNFG